MTYNELSPQCEKRIQDFQADLAGISGPEDMFPPDNPGNVREPRRPVPYSGLGDASVKLAEVHDLTAYRNAVVYRGLGNLCLV